MVYQLSGKARRNFKDKIKWMKPKTAHEELLNEMNNDLIEHHKNHQFTHSLSVLQKARSEILGENDRHPNDLADIILKIQEYKNNHPFIRHYIYPFTIYLGCEEQINLLKIKGGSLILRFDATGTVIRIPYDGSKRVYIYVGVVVIDGKIYPVLSFITNDHKSSTIVDYLIYIKNYWIENNVSWPPFESFVSDMAWASINALMLAWNNITVLQYMKKIYNNIINNDKLPSGLILLFTCYPHLMEMISRRLKKTKIKGVQAKLCLEIIAVIAHSVDLNEMASRVENMMIILLSSKETNQVVDAIKYFSNLNEKIKSTIDEEKIKKKEEIIEKVDISDTSDSSNKDKSIDDNSDDDDDDNDDTMRSNEAIYIRSPFYRFFFNIYQKIKKKVEKVNEWEDDNKLFSKSFCFYLLKNLLPYAPIWTTIIHPEKIHSVNTHAEIHFKMMKAENEKNLKVGRFIDKIYCQTTAAYKQLSLPQPKSHVKSRQKKINQPDNFESEECWNRFDSQPRKKKLKTYEDKENLIKLSAEYSCIKLKFYDNNTIKDPHYYYHSSPPRKFFVAYTEDMNTGENILLMSDDYFSLFESNWLVNFVIDYWMNSKLKKNNLSQTVAYVSCEISKYILEGTRGEKQFYKNLENQWKGKSKILLPCQVYDSHWILVYVDITTSTIYFFDSNNRQKTKNSTSELFTQNFIAFYEKNNSTNLIASDNVDEPAAQKKSSETTHELIVNNHVDLINNYKNEEDNSSVDTQNEQGNKNQFGDRNITNDMVNDSQLHKCYKNHKEKNNFQIEDANEYTTKKEFDESIVI
ncbi:hypothetical protein HCN44_010330 [Aphidius gifuensis]|uniref:Ubiquitin-like protease family profile domain-containing protein n=1 Tax=Aphidius gifuensis TaxID=684658 RepID=A0A834XUL0_APHGI|nr:hypothetical protein HCN44_010330 [Aphidius gifuensis]